MNKFFISIAFAVLFFAGLGSLVEKAGARFKSDERALVLLKQARLAIGGEQAVANRPCAAPVQPGNDFAEEPCRSGLEHGRDGSLTTRRVLRILTARVPVTAERRARATLASAHRRDG